MSLENFSYHEHPELKGKHSFLSPSKIAWQNYDDDKLILSYKSSRAAEIGTALHELVTTYIDKMERPTKSELSGAIRYDLLRRDLPLYLDIDAVVENIRNYIRDAIGFRMKTEFVLKYSDKCFGTADTLVFNRKKGILRIHDLKTGITPAKIEQLNAYAALFCLEYKIRPADIDIFLRIYQDGEIFELKPELDILVPLMDDIVHKSKILADIDSGEI